MSAPTAQCPNCFARLSAADSADEPTVCPSCEREVIPSAGRPAGAGAPLPVARAIPRPPAAPVARPVARPVATPVPARDDHKPGSRSRRREDDDEKPRTNSRHRRDEDEDDEPKRAKTRAGGLPLVIMGGVLTAVVLVGGVSVAAVVLLSPSGKQAQATTPPPDSPTTSPKGEPNPRGVVNNHGDFLLPKPEVPEVPKGGDFAPPPPVDPPRPPVNPLPNRPPVNPPVNPWAPAAPAPAPAAPKLAAGETELKLPGTVADTCSGGGGRYFILHLSGKKQLAVFDVTQSKVVKYLPLSSDTVRFAAGQDKLIVAYPDDGVLARFDLTTFEKEVTAKSPVSGTHRHLCMGSASVGPLLVWSGDGTGGVGTYKLTFLDPLTLKPSGTQLGENQGVGMGGAGVGGDNMHFRASPDGSLFGAWTSGLSPSGLNCITVRGKKATAKYEHDTVGYIVPGPDGRLYTGQGVYTAGLKKLSKQPGADRWGRAAYLPAADGTLYLHLSTQGDNGIGGGLGGVHMDKELMKADVRMDGDDRVLFTFKDLGPFGTDAWAGGDFTSDKRVHFHPNAHLLVTVPQTNDRLLLRKFDLEAALTASGVDYLYVTSRPPAAVPGKAYEYQIAVRSKKGGVKYKLDAGPTGLKVSDAGKVTWTAPASFTPEQVIITISDASKQEVFHTFEVVPGEAKAVGPGGGK